MSRVMSSCSCGCGKSIRKLAVEVAIREKKGRHVNNKLRKVVEGGSSVARNVEDEDWVAEGVLSQVETDFEEEEEVSLKRKSSRRGSGALRIEDVGERRGGGGHAVMEDVIDVNAAAASRRGGGTAVTHQHRAPVLRVNEAMVAKEVVGRARIPGTARATTGTDVGANTQGFTRGQRSEGGRGEAGGGRPGGVRGKGRRCRRTGGGRRSVGEQGASAKCAGWNRGSVEALGGRHPLLERKGRERHCEVDAGSAPVSCCGGAGVQAPAVCRSIVLPHPTIPQHKIDDESELNAAQERALKVQTIGLRVIHRQVFKSTSRQRGYHVAYGYALDHAATDIARAIWLGEDWRVCVSPMVFHITLDMDMKLPLWFVGTNIKDRHENNELAAYQEASIQRLVGAFTSAVSTAEGIDGGRVSQKRLKSVAEAMRIMLAATMWLMRMSGDDHRAHYDAWVFVQLTTKSTLIASMHRSFDARRHIVQAATAITDKLAEPPMTLVAPPLYIPDWASIDVKFSHDATLSSPMEAKKLDWLGTGPPEDIEDDKANDEGSGGG
ncbi:hypothetical protein CBR_g23528 [Chara braunii]|uniref:Uncharacterized protein n=1 Tax=Chara braunii TaxID=69332 RepID=A0A388L4N0_CHABU|nr:hypothetical protein CBR_g23528 [Chara braunii]|eukprot:GBG77202.1 hypothetical protein CBR_g23528 [Chara braunii]